MRTNLVRALDWLLTTLALGVDALVSPRAWRVGQRLRGGIEVVHEAVLRAGARFCSVRASRELLLTAQAAAPKEVPAYPAPGLTSSRVSSRAERLLEGVCVLEPGREIRIEAVSWQRAPFASDRSLARFQFHALGWVGELVAAYRLTENPAYLERARELCQRWIAECLYTERDAEVWDDHGTALRAVTLCQLWAACWLHEPQGSSFMWQLLSAIVRHADKLAHPLFYRDDHNHGVTQAYALLAIGLCFPAHPRAAAWVACGRARLEAQMTRNVSGEGLHLEHSPYYHFYVFRQLHCAQRLADAYGVPLSSAYTERLRAMLKAGSHLIKPDGTLPALGDTVRASPILAERHEIADWPADVVGEYLYARSQGAEGSVPSLTSILLPESGYAVFRSGWGTREPFRQERFLVFRVSTLETSHIHRDAFSFELYAYGDDLIVDSGGPFAYGHPIRREFFLTTAAHNTVVVDGRDQDVCRARVLRWEASGDLDILVAEHQAVPGVLHRRAVLFVRRRYFLILDHLVGRQAHRYRQLFHLSPSLEAAREGLEIATRHASAGPTVRIVPLLEDALDLELVRGAENPRQGWVCVGGQRMVPNTVVEYGRFGGTAVFATLLVPERPAVPSRVAGSITGRPLETEARIRVTLDDLRDEIVVPRDGRGTLEGAAR